MKVYESKRDDPNEPPRPVPSTESVWAKGWRLSFCEICQDWTAHADDVTVCTRCGVVRDNQGHG